MRGQVTIIAIFIALISLIVLAVTAPIFNTAVSMIVNATAGDATSQFLAMLIFPVLLISLILSILGYANFARQQQYEIR